MYHLTFQRLVYCGTIFEAGSKNKTDIMESLIQALILGKLLLHYTIKMDNWIKK